MSIDVRQFLPVFFDEGREGLQTVEASLLRIDPEHPDVEEVHAIFRAVHSLKGASATFGFPEISDFTHTVEGILDAVRSGARRLSRSLVDALLEAVDLLREMLAAAERGDAHPAESTAPVVRRLEALADPPFTEAASTPLPSPLLPGPTVWTIRFRPHAELLQSGNEPLRMLRELATLGTSAVEVLAEGLPTLGEIDPERCYLAWQVELVAEVEEHRIREVFEWVLDECDLEISRRSGGAQSATRDPSDEAAPAAARVDAARSDVSAIRVSTEKLDELMNLVGEIVIARSMLADRLRGAGGDALDALALLDRQTRALQETVLSVRMRPIDYALRPLPRLVRDLAGALGKRVRLMVSGEQTEVDNVILEKISEPLLHIVRNAIDHGIEPPEVRRRAGKPEQALLHVSAYHLGGNIVVDVRDDGAGLDRARILARARERGLVAPGEALDDARIDALVFAPGLSTVAAANDVSGRGVGMDVVRSNMRELGGEAEILSEPGRGTLVRLRLPLTLAILEGQFVSVGGQTFVIPLLSVVESLRPSAGAISAVGSCAEVYRLREQYVPLVRLGERLGLAERAAGLELLVVVEFGGRRAALHVDELLGQGQVVIKSLELHYRRTEAIAGATVLGDGSVALILDPRWLTTSAPAGGTHGIGLAA